jgi:hypothetical protein
MGTPDYVKINCHNCDSRCVHETKLNYCKFRNLEVGDIFNFKDCILLLKGRCEVCGERNAISIHDKRIVCVRNPKFATFEELSYGRHICFSKIEKKKVKEDLNSSLFQEVQFLKVLIIICVLILGFLILACTSFISSKVTFLEFDIIELEELVIYDYKINHESNKLSNKFYDLILQNQKDLISNFSKDKEVVNKNRCIIKEYELVDGNRYLFNEFISEKCTYVGEENE